jgi:hypothetical protein
MSSIDVPPAANEGFEVEDGEQPMPGELIYEYTPQVTRIVDYGASCSCEGRRRRRKALGSTSTWRDL